MCSALKRRYREKLSESIKANCQWIFLEGDYSLIQDRLNHRAGHFMSALLLQSQFDALEIPQDAIRIDIRKSPQEISEAIVSRLKR